MHMRIANPYLHFNGNCEEAFLFYKGIFGGEMEISRFTDVPPDNRFPEEESNKILHVSLPLSEYSILMGSDIPDAFPKPNKGSNFFISLSVNSHKDADLIFYQLAEGGQIAMPLDHTFWGAYFGMVIDPFGVQWMISFDEK